VPSYPDIAMAKLTPSFLKIGGPAASLEVPLLCSLVLDAKKTVLYYTRHTTMKITRMTMCLKRRGKSDEMVVLLFRGHSKYVYLTAMKPIL
jgi:hypothetical protein